VNHPGQVHHERALRRAAARASAAASIATLALSNSPVRRTRFPVTTWRASGRTDHLTFNLALHHATGTRCTYLMELTATGWPARDGSHPHCRPD
jgi:hypothetical protein